MFAVIRAGGRQYRVATDDVIEIDRVADEVGDVIGFDQVLLLGGPDGTTVGDPVVGGATVTGEVVEHRRGDKVIAFKKRRRKNSRRKRGHRQHFTLVRITDVLAAGQKPTAKKAASAKPAATEVSAPEAAESPVETAAHEAPVELAFIRPEGEPDDLKKISGVGPVLEEKLNALGITRYDQIAAFTPDDIAKVDDLLNFKGRIDRDNWLVQAAELASGDSSKED